MPAPDGPRAGAGGGAPDLGAPIFAALLLGLAPFLPEPHIVGKLRWVAGGAVGMAPMDWFDLVLHGAPWAWLAWTLVARLRWQVAQGTKAGSQGTPGTR